MFVRLALLAAGLLAIAGCGGSSQTNASHPARSSSRTSTASSSSATTARGGPVPPRTRATSVTFISPRSAFVLGTAPCAHRPCSAILRTRDRGRSWRGMPAPRESVSRFSGRGLWGLRFADARHGYAFGRGLWETDNGSRSWHRAAGPARIVLALEAVKDRELVAAASCRPGARHCGDRLGLYRRRVSGGRWTRVARTPPHAFVGSIAVHGSVVWAIMGMRLYVSSDGGVSFRSRRAPCRPRTVGLGTAVSDDGRHTYLVCSGEAAAGSVAKRVYRTRGPRSPWRHVGNPPRVGDEDGLSAGSDHAVIVAAASGASWLYRSTDGGHHWRTVLARNDGGVGWGDLGFTTSTDGVVIHGPAINSRANDPRKGQLLLTDNGGRTWRRVTF